MATARSTRTVLRTLQARGPVPAARSTRTVLRILQSKPLPKTGASTRVVRRVLQSLYSFAGGLVSGMETPDVKPTPFPHNWISSVRVETSFLTDVTQSAGSVSEERRGLRERPGRVVTALFTGMTKADSTRLVLAALRYNHQTNVFPLYSDVSLVTEASTGNVLKCDTRYRRFYRGMLILIAEHDGRRLVNEQYAQVIAISNTSLRVSSLTGTVPVGARVYPLIQVDPNLEIEPTLLTDDKVTLQVAVLELLGPSTLPQSATDDPSQLAFLTWKGDYPIFDFREDWVQGLQVRIVRPGEKFGQGRDQVISLAGARPKFGFSVSHIFPNREEYFNYLKFAESRMGRLRPFWFINPQTLFDVVGVTGNDIEVGVTVPGAEDWLAFFEYIGIVQTDGTLFISAISDATYNGGTGRVTFTLVDTPPDLADIRRMSSAHFCRFNTDAIREDWDTTGLVRMNSEIIELLNEVEAPVDGDFPDPIT